MGLLTVSLLAGCGKKEDAMVGIPEATPTPAPQVSKPTVIAVPPASTTPSPTPEATPTPFPTRTAYVAVAFQSVSDVGTHDFPQGIAVTVIGEEGEDYVVEYQGVSVRNSRSYFSDTPIAMPTPTPVAETPLPEATPSLPSEPAEAQADLTSEERAASALLTKIKDVNEEIRVANEKLDSDKASGSSAAARAEAARIEKLKKQKAQLSEDLTRTAKP